MPSRLKHWERVDAKIPAASLGELLKAEKKIKQKRGSTGSTVDDCPTRSVREFGNLSLVTLPSFEG